MKFNTKFNVQMWSFNFRTLFHQAIMILFVKTVDIISLHVVYMFFGKYVQAQFFCYIIFKFKFSSFFYHHNGYWVHFWKTISGNCGCRRVILYPGTSQCGYLVDPYKHSWQHSHYPGSYFLSKQKLTNSFQLVGWKFSKADLMVGIITLPIAVTSLIKEGLRSHASPISGEWITNHMTASTSCTATVFSIL